MAKPELGTKRICPTTGRKFYDLNQNPVISPYSGEIVPIAPVARSRAEMRAAANREEAEAETPETADVELVSLEDADAEATGKKSAADGSPDVDADDGDAEIEDTEDDTFIEEEEEEDTDVSEIIGGDIEVEEET